jgi:hypothetical protein
MSNPAVIGANANTLMNRMLVFEAYQFLDTAMAFKRLQARAAAGIPDLDGIVARRRRQPG